MKLHWDYNYYQPQTNNKWIVEKILAIRNKEDKNDTIDNMLAY